MHKSPSKRTTRSTPPDDPAAYYRRSLRPLDLQDLDVALAASLENEIALLRVVIRRVFEEASRDEAMSAQDWSKMLGALGLAASRLADLLKTQKAIGQGSSAASMAIQQALNEVVEELGLRP